MLQSAIGDRIADHPIVRSPIHSCAL